MTRFRITIAAVLCAFLLGAASAQVLPAHDIFLPLVTNGQAPTVAVVKLLEGDYTLVSAAISPQGCEYLAVMDRAGGNLIHIGYLVGDTFVEVDLPAQAQIAAPAFVPEGSKHAGMDLLVTADRLEVLWTTRPEGATSGGFDLYRMTMPVPPCAGR